MSNTPKDLVYLDLFSGTGGFSKGFIDAGLDIKHHYFSEIEKHPIANYKYNFPNSIHIGDVKSITKQSIPMRPNIITFGFPCQDLSIAGKGEGLGGARSSLFFEAVRIIKEFKPEVFIFENVKGLLSSKGGSDFTTVLRTIADIGLYECEWQLCNTSWFLPQNRERIYFVGHLGGISIPGVFPFREIDSAHNETNANKEKLYENSLPLTARGQTNRTGSFVRQLNQNKNFGENSTRQEDRIYDPNGLMACMGSSRLESKVNIMVRPVLTPDRKEKRQNGRRFKENNDDSFTLNTQDRHGIMITTNTIEGFDVAKDGDSINLSNPNSKTRRGRIGKEKANTLETAPNMGVLENSQIRQLTEIECERLQGFDVNEIFCIFILWKENYLEHQSNYVNVDKQSPRLQKPVLIVEKKELQENVLFAKKNLSTSCLPISKHAQKIVHIRLEEQKVVIHNQEKLIWSASVAESQKRFPHHTKVEDFVLLIVLINQIREKITSIGKVVFQVNEHFSMEVKNGKMHVNTFGKEITQLAGGAEIDLIILKKLLKFTTLEDFQKENLELLLKTLFSFAIHAIDGFTQKKINWESIYSIEISCINGWTKFGIYDGVVKQIPKTARYKMLGNAVTTILPREIAKRLNFTLKNENK